MDDLEILDGRLRDSPVEVEHVGLGVVVPHRSLVVQLDHALRAFVLPAGQQGLVVLWNQNPEALTGGTQPPAPPRPAPPGHHRATAWPPLNPPDPTFKIIIKLHYYQN